MGNVTFRDPDARTEIQVALDSDGDKDGGESNLRFTGEGSLRSEKWGEPQPNA